MAVKDISKPTVEINNLRFTYPGIDGQPPPGSTPLIDHFSLTLNSGDRCLLVGSNGAGSLLGPSFQTLHFEWTQKGTSPNVDFVFIFLRFPATNCRGNRISGGFGCFWATKQLEFSRERHQFCGFLWGNGPKWISLIFSLGKWVEFSRENCSSFGKWALEKD